MSWTSELDSYISICKRNYEVGVILIILNIPYSNKSKKEFAGQN